jgi:hemerythrin-like domain-containing protein
MQEHRSILNTYPADSIQPYYLNEKNKLASILSKFQRALMRIPQLTEAAADSAVAEEATSYVQLQDMAFTSYERMIISTETYVVLSTRELSSLPQTIGSIFVPFSYIRNSRSYKRIN